MARPEKNTVDFPKWNPQKTTLRCIKGLDVIKAKKAFRSSSSAFIKKPLVRSIILKKHNNKCCNCNDDKNLQIDHIKSVYKCFITKDYFFCNTEENLQVLCVSCNTSKSPNLNNILKHE